MKYVINAEREFNYDDEKYKDIWKIYWVDDETNIVTETTAFEMRK